MQEFYSRYDDPTMMECEDCKWRGKVMDCKHGYKGSPIRGFDIEPMDYCPRCNSENLIEMQGGNASLISVLV